MENGVSENDSRPLSPDSTRRFCWRGELFGWVLAYEDSRDRQTEECRSSRERHSASRRYFRGSGL